MPERIVTDSRGQRWDVIQSKEQGEAVFRHQSGREFRAELRQSIDALSSDDLLELLDQVRRRDGYEDVGHGGIDVSFDQDGYETGR